MKILIIGNKGNMGRRYSHICQSLGHEVVGVDIDSDIASSSIIESHRGPAIIASPTETHSDWITKLSQHGIDMLCEKPISCSHEVADRLYEICISNHVRLDMVCNWEFAEQIALHEDEHDDMVHFPASTGHFYYDCWNSGRDGLAWDCVQFFLNSNIPTLHNHSNHLDARYNGTKVTETHIAKSYAAMIKTWLATPKKLPSRIKVLGAHARVEKYIEEQEAKECSA